MILVEESRRLDRVSEAISAHYGKCHIATCRLVPTLRGRTRPLSGWGADGGSRRRVVTADRGHSRPQLGGERAFMHLIFAPRKLLISLTAIRGAEILIDERRACQL